METRNALQALAKIQGREFDLVLIKFDLAGGLEVIRHVRQSQFTSCHLLCYSTEATNAARSKPLLKVQTIVTSDPSPADQLIARIKTALPKHGGPRQGSLFHKRYHNR